MSGPEGKENSQQTEKAAGKSESFASKFAKPIAALKEFLQLDKQAAEIIATAAKEKTGEANPPLVGNQEYHDARAITVSALRAKTDPDTIKQVLQNYIEKEGPVVKFNHVNTSPDATMDDVKPSLRTTLTSKDKQSPQIGA